MPTSGASNVPPKEAPKRGGMDLCLEHVVMVHKARSCITTSAKDEFFGGINRFQVTFDVYQREL